MDIKADEISKIIRDQIGGYSVDVDVAEVGSVISLGDGIARVHGVEGSMAGEMLEFPHEVFGIALNLEEGSVGVVLLGPHLWELRMLLPPHCRTCTSPTGLVPKCCRMFGEPGCYPRGRVAQQIRPRPMCDKLGVWE